VSTLRDEERARYVNPYRLAARCSCVPDTGPEPSDEPHPDCELHGQWAEEKRGTPLEGTSAAPPWVPAVVDGLAALLPDEPEWRAFLIPYTLRWCHEGEPVMRAEMALTYAGLLPYDGRAGKLQEWLDAMRRARRGRTRAATRLDHFEPARVRRRYEDPHPRTWGALNAELIIAEMRCETLEDAGAQHRAEAKEASEWYARCAAACGIEHQTDTVSYPGPIEAVEEQIRMGARALSNEYETAQIVEQYRNALTRIACMTKHPSNAATMEAEARRVLNGTPSPAGEIVCKCEVLSADEGGGTDPRSCPEHGYTEGKNHGAAIAIRATCTLAAAAVTRRLAMPHTDDAGEHLRAVRDEILRLEKNLGETAPVTPNNAGDVLEVTITEPFTGQATVSVGRSGDRS
jgi:hypothetical protein